jgi:hypothetical protein
MAFAICMGVIRGCHVSIFVDLAISFTLFSCFCKCTCPASAGITTSRFNSATLCADFYARKYMFSQLHKVAKQVNNVIIGKELQIRQALACLLAGGHLLIEDLPGVGKTTLAHALAISLGLKFNRLQFTSDLLPADVIGVSIFDREKNQFIFHPGPVFTQVLLADEINRATPKHSLPCSKQWKSIRSQPKARHANCCPIFRDRNAKSGASGRHLSVTGITAGPFSDVSVTRLPGCGGRTCAVIG